MRNEVRLDNYLLYRCRAGYPRGDFCSACRNDKEDDLMPKRRGRRSIAPSGLLLGEEVKVIDDGEK